MTGQDEAGVIAGARRPRGRRVTSYDVAVAADVAQSTVSRCFQDGTEISPATRARVLAVAAELGYTPNALARSLITRRSHMVGVIVTEFTLRTNPDIVNGIGRALAAHGTRLMLMAVESEAAAREAAHGAIGYPLDGLVVGATLGSEDIQPFLRRDVPVVFFNRPVALPRVDRVATDHDGAAREVASVLHAAGHRRFLCLGGPAGWPVNQERTQGFLAALAELAVGDVPVVAAEQSYRGGRDAFLAHLRGAERPDAVFCVNDQLAFGVLDACRFDLGLLGPGVISVVGFDDVAEAGHQSFDLTTVRQQVDAMAKAAVELLLRRRKAPDAPARTVLLAGELVRRSSARL